MKEENELPPSPFDVDKFSLFGWDGYHPDEMLAKYINEYQALEDINKKPIRMPDANGWELEAIAYGLNKIMMNWYRDREHVVPDYMDTRPSIIKGADSYADKIGLQIFNPYGIDDFKSFQEEHGDEWGLIWEKNMNGGAE